MDIAPPIIFKNKTKDFELNNNSYKLKIGIQEILLDFELSLNNTFPKKIYSKKLTKENLQNLSILFMDKKAEINSYFQIISDLLDNDKMTIKDNETNSIKLVFSPQIYMIKDFEIELKENKLNQSEVNDLLIQKIKELETEIKNLKNNILLISQDKKKSILYNLLKQNPCVNKISVFEPNILPDLTIIMLSKYKILIYDICNGGFNKNANKDIIKNYVTQGGNVIVTHDHWTYSKINPKTGGCCELLGARLEEQSYKTTTKAKILQKNHPIFKSFYDLSSTNDNIDIYKTHKTDTIYDNIDTYNKDLVIQLEDGKRGEYLLIKEIGKGKIIFWNVEYPSIIDIEKKLFINLLSWIYD